MRVCVCVHANAEGSPTFIVSTRGKHPVHCLKRQCLDTKLNGDAENQSTSVVHVFINLFKHRSESFSEMLSC